MIVQLAKKEDIKAWLQLASEVEYLFGPMVDDPKFLLALEKNISRGSAFCVREHDGLSGSPLLGGLLFSSSRAPTYNIGWLSVASNARKLGVATALIKHVLALVICPADITVTTFGEDVADGMPARRLYIKNGFVAEDMISYGLGGGSRQAFRLSIQ